MTVRFAAALFSIAFGLAGCQASLAATPVRLLLNWQAQAEQCGFYQALAKGYYSQAGLDMSLVNGGPDINSGMLLASGNVDFGLVDSIQTLMMRGHGLPVTAVAAFFQKDPQTIAAHPDPAVQKPEDLRGHPILIANDSRNRFWQWAKARFGYSDEQLRPYAFSGLPFLADPTAAQQGYITNDGFVIGKVLGKPPKSFLLADYGYDNYANVLLTTSQMLQHAPDIVARVVEASKRGWQECKDGDVGPARSAILKANTNYPAALFDYSLALMREDLLITGSGDRPVGSMSDTRWSRFLSSMQQLGVVPSNADYHEAYTMRFSGQ